MQPRSIVAQVYVRGAAGNRVPAAHAPPGEEADLFQVGLEKFHLASAKLFAFPGTEVPVAPAAPTGRERRIPGNREPLKPLPAAAPSARLRLPARAGQGTPGHPRFPLRPQSEQTPARRSRGFLGRPGSSGAARRRAARGCLTGKVACAPGRAGEGGREGRGECRAGPAAEPRVHNACAGRERNHGLGWRLPAGERKARTARARRKSGRSRARAPGRCAPKGGPRVGRAAGGRPASAAHACFRSRWRRGRPGGGGARQ